MNGKTKPIPYSSFLKQHLTSLSNKLFLEESKTPKKMMKYNGQKKTNALCKFVTFPLLF